MFQRFAVLLVLAALLPACGTLTSGTSQSVTVTTDPPGAACTLTREGAVIGVVNPTPGTVTVSKSSRDVAISCTRAGHAAGATQLPAEFQAMTAGNILLGGVIGLAIDAASGAMSRYPESVAVVLPPDSFPDARARDDFFDQRVSETRRAFGTRIAAAEANCATAGREICTREVADLVATRDEELARMERLRAEARLTP